MTPDTEARFLVKAAVEQCEKHYLHRLEGQASELARLLAAVREAKTALEVAEPKLHIMSEATRSTEVAKVLNQVRKAIAAQVLAQSRGE